MISSTGANPLLLLILAPLLLPFLSSQPLAAAQGIASGSSSTASPVTRGRYVPAPASQRGSARSTRYERRDDAAGAQDEPAHVRRARVQRKRDRALKALGEGLERSLVRETHGSFSPSSFQRNAPQSASPRGKMDLKLNSQWRGGATDGNIARRAEGVTNETAVVMNLGSGDNIYTIPLQIGSPPTTFLLQVDTASSDLLLATSPCSTSSLCPSSADLYHPGRSSTWKEVRSNGTAWEAVFGDGSAASGFVGLDSVGMDGDYIGAGSSATTTSKSTASSTATGTLIQPQVNGVDGFTLPSLLLGLINETTIDFASEGTQGVLGLGFPRGTVLGRAVAEAEGLTATTTTVPGSTTEDVTFTILTASSSNSGTGTSSIAAAAPTSTAINTSPYYPTFLETLFASPILDYPVFSLALSNSSSPFSSASDEASITFGGVSAEFVLVDETGDGAVASGRTVGDIEWWDVVPFARVAEAASASEGNATGNSIQSGTTTSTSAAAATTTASNWLNDLENEVYLYWALELSNITVNGTDVPLEPTYNSSVTGRTSSIALIDVGANGIYGPQQDVIRIFDEIKDSRVVSDGQWAVPCDTAQTMTFSFGPNGRVVELQPSEWIIGAVEGSALCLAWPVALAPSADGIDWQLGTPFLRKVYTVFGYGIDGLQSPVIGFLPLPDRASTTGAAVSSTGSTSSAATGVTSTNMTSAKTTTTLTSSTSEDPTDPTPVSVQDASEVASALTVTFTTVLPNQVLANPASTTPPYEFQTTSIPTLGQAQTVGLANVTAYPSIMDVAIISPSTVTMSMTAPSSMATGSGIGSALSPGSSTSASSGSGSGATSGGVRSDGNAGSQQAALTLAMLVVVGAVLSMCA